LDRAGYGIQYVKMTAFHATAGGNSRNSLRARVFSKSIFKRTCGYLERKRDNLILTSVKVVPQTFTSTQEKFEQKILQFGCATAGKLPIM
jgi:hypothetical protein